MKKKNFLNKNWTLPLIVIFLSGFSILPFFHSGIFSMHDATQTARIYEMGKALREGNLPVRWVSDLGYGYGYPIFNFYSPFAYYLGGILFLFGFPLIFSTKLVFIFAILLSALTMFIFAKKILGNLPALVASIIYIYFPYHAVNIYVRGDLAELFAYAFLPLVFLGVIQILFNAETEKNIKNLFKWPVFLSAVVALMIISHNLSAFMLVIVVGIFALLVWFLRKAELRKLILFFASFLLGFLLSSFYSLPALLEMKYTNVFSQVGGGADYKDHFVCLSQLWYSPWGYGGSVKGCADGMSFALGKINIIFALISFFIFVYLFFRKEIKIKNIQLAIFALLIFSLFMILPFSAFIWKVIPYISFLQYPWRFLNFVGFFISIAIALLIFNLKKFLSEKASIFLSILIILLTIFYNVKLFKAQYFINFDNNYYRSAGYLNWPVSKISDEYMPKFFKKPAGMDKLPKNKIEIYQGNGEVKILSEKTKLIKADINLNMPSVIRVNLAYFPELKVLVNGRESMFDVKNDGIYLNLPKGSTALAVIFTQTPLEIISNLVSFISIIGLVIGIIKVKFFLNS